jgi:hypothetical protein
VHIGKWAFVIGSPRSPYFDHGSDFGAGGPVAMAVLAHLKKGQGMQTEISPYNATEYRDALARLALQRANIMHLVDLKRGGYSPRRTEMRISRLTARPQSISILSKSAAPIA